MPINQMYRTWIRQICELRPNQRITQVRNFVWLMVGMFHSRSVQLLSTTIRNGHHVASDNNLTLNHGCRE